VRWRRANPSRIGDGAISLLGRNVPNGASINNITVRCTLDLVAGGQAKRVLVGHFQPGA
jgi:hypothetical protein